MALGAQISMHLAGGSFKGHAAAAAVERDTHVVVAPCGSVWVRACGPCGSVWDPLGYKISVFT